MTLDAAAALFLAMAVLAAVPSVSVLTVSARAAALGFLHGACAALGVVVGDIVFILLAVFGLALLVEALGDLFFLVKYLGGAYLIWLGLSLWRSRAQAARIERTGRSSLASSFMTGLLITLGDQKAVLFYLGFLPAFLDLSALSYLDVIAVVLIAIASVGGVKLAYAYAADRAGAVLGSRTGAAMNVAAACVLIAVGAFMLAGAIAGSI